MTAVTARAAGVDEAWVASPNPTPIVLAAAAVAGADGVLAAGGAHAVAALAFGAGPVPPADIVVGPGNRWAAKQLRAGGIAMEGAATVGSPTEAIALCHAIVPEHPELSIVDAASSPYRFRHQGALFIGGHTRACAARGRRMPHGRLRANSDRVEIRVYLALEWQVAALTLSGGATMRISTATLVAPLAVLLMLPLMAPALAPRAQSAADGGVLVRVDGNVTVPEGARYELIVVVRGDAQISGDADAVVVVGGTASLFGAEVEQLVVVGGEAQLTNGTRITGDIGLIDSELRRDEDTTVLGEVREGPHHQVFRGLWVFGLLVAFGYLLAMLAAGVIAAAVAPHGVRVAGQTLSEDPLLTIIWTLGLWVLLPLAAIIVIPTVVGIPVGVGTFLFVLPTLAFLGYLVTGIRLGDWILEQLRRSVEQPRPYLAALAGVGTLLLLGMIPFLGGFVAPIAGALGSGAILLTVWRAVRGTPEPVPEAVEV